MDLPSSHPFTIRFGPDTPPAPITVQSILNSDLVHPAPSDPFADILGAIRADLYNHDHTLVIVGYVFSGLIGLSLYKLLPTPRGTYIMPNVVQIWLLCTIFYCVFSFPYLWREILVGGGSLWSSQIWLMLNWVPVFSGLWNVAWGTAVSAQLANARLNSADGQSLPHRRPSILRPIVFNIFFPLVWIAGVAAIAGTFGYATVVWNRGVVNWNLLQDELVEATDINGGAAGGAETVLLAVPDADERLEEMTDAWWTFQMPWIVCMTFSAITAATMALAAARQISLLLEQIRIINHELASARVCSIERPAMSESSARTNSLERKAGIKSVLCKVILTTLTLTICMLGYMASCIVGQTEFNQTKLFKRYKSPKAHLYALTFVYSALALIVVIVIIFQSLDPTVLQTKVESNERSSRSSATLLAGPGVKKRPMSSSFSGASSGKDQTTMFKNPFDFSPGSLEAAPGSPLSLGSPDDQSLDASGGASAAPLSPAASAEVKRSNSPKLTRSHPLPESWQRVQPRKAVPEL